MALAHGTSTIICNAPTSITSLHLETAIHLVTLLTRAKFAVEEVCVLTSSRPLSTRAYSCLHCCVAIFSVLYQEARAFFQIFESELNVSTIATGGTSNHRSDDSWLLPTACVMCRDRMA